MILIGSEHINTRFDKDSGKFCIVFTNKNNKITLFDDVDSVNIFISLLKTKSKEVIEEVVKSEIALSINQKEENNMSFVQREFDRITVKIGGILASDTVPEGTMLLELRAAQQALGWALEPTGAKSPYNMITGENIRYPEFESPISDKPE